MLGEAGLVAYEVSNYATPGEESRPIFPTGRATTISASARERMGELTLDSSLRGGGADEAIQPGALDRVATLAMTRTRIATSTIKSPERWLEAVGREGHGAEVWSEVEPHHEIEERVMMGLRLKGGIDLAAFKKQTGLDLLSHIDLKNTRALCEGRPARGCAGQITGHAQRQACFKSPDGRSA